MSIMHCDTVVACVEMALAKTTAQGQWGVGWLSSFNAWVRNFRALATSSKLSELAAYFACFCASVMADKDGWKPAMPCGGLYIAAPAVSRAFRAYIQFQTAEAQTT